MDANGADWWQMQSQLQNEAHWCELLLAVYHRGLKYEALELASALGLGKEFRKAVYDHRVSFELPTKRGLL